MINLGDLVRWADIEGRQLEGVVRALSSDFCVVFHRAYGYITIKTSLLRKR